MTALEILPIVIYLGGFAVFALVLLKINIPTNLKCLFLVALCAAFTIFTFIGISREGVVMFWTNHTANITGNQVWFDLVFAVSIAFYLIIPRARAVGMKVFPWAIAIGMTASIALLPMLARLLWLERNKSV